MPKESLASTCKSLEITIQDLREVMDEAQGMYHHAFVRTLDIHHTLQTILTNLKDAQVDDRREEP